jgi:predicted O-methyltransferase YrrM
MHLTLNVGQENKMKYNTFTLIYKYISYLWKASNGQGHGVHSPFVYAFIKNVLNSKSKGASIDAIELYRHQLLNNQKEISILDFGAGADSHGNKSKTIAQIAKGSLKPKKYSALLSRIVAYFKPHQVLEMGTSLGITTCYLVQGVSNASVVTMEGAPTVAQEALTTFKNLGCQNIQLIEGNFDQSLPNYLNSISTIGIAYVDGNHRYIPTMQYFNLLLAKSDEHSIFIFDDIHWSSEMEKAWAEIKSDTRIALTIDLFYIGIVFLKKGNKEKENFIIKF